MGIQVKKSLLSGTNYEWQASKGDDPTKRVQDAKFFNRKEGYEVIPMIQKIVNHFEYQTPEDVQKVEEIIANELPGSVRGQQNVREWLIDYITKK